MNLPTTGGSQSLSAAFWGFPGGSVGKNPPANAGDAGSIPGLGRLPEEGNGNPLQYSCLGNPIDTRAWQAIICGAAKQLDKTSQLNNNNVIKLLKEIIGDIGKYFFNIILMHISQNETN